MSDQDAFGPIDFILIEYPDDADTTACVDAITALVEQGTVRLYDILLIRRAADGSYSGVDLGDTTAASGFTAFEGARSGLIGDDDVSAVIEVMRPGTIAALIVFENAFWPGGDKTMVFAELGEVSVSEDGETWKTFPCDATGDGEGSFPGCAGATPTLEYDAEQLIPLDPALSGGDAFDLADVGLKRARFVKIHDLETLPPVGMSSGFDLDAVGVIHAR